MYKGELAQLSVKKMLRKGEEANGNIFNCKVWEYNPTEESIYLILQDGALTDITLDAQYSCKVLQDAETIECIGNVVERYRGEKGKTLKFKIKNGFYKISLKCVDK